MTLYGHDDAAQALLAAAASGRLHHAWLITGPQGIGKASFAEAAALRLLADAAGPPPAMPGLTVPDSHPTAQLFHAGSHPDYKLVKREVWKKGKTDELVPENERSADDEVGRNIRIVQIRWVGRMLSMLPSLSARRVIVIDSVDELERNAANALLKSLEEPPAGTVFLLVSHAPGRLLPTIRSRCRLLRLSPLADADMRAALARALPDASTAELDGLVRAGQGSPGSAVAIAGLDVAGLDRAIAELMRDGDPRNALRSALAKQLATKAARPRYELFLERAPAAIATAARTRSGPALADAIAAWERARGLADSALRLSLDAQATSFELASTLARLAPARA